MSRRFQFSLRDILVVTMVVSVILGVAAFRRHRYEVLRRQMDMEEQAAAEAFVEQLRKIGEQTQ